MFIHFDVIEQKIQRKPDKNHLVNYSKNYLYLSFQFSDSWKGLRKYIIFKDEENYKYDLEFDEETELYVIGVPSFILEDNYFKFTVYGVTILDENHEKRITTEDMIIKLHLSGFTEGASGVPDDEMVTDIYTVLSNGLQEVNILLETKSDKNHTHILSEVTDYTVDTELSSVSENPVQNKVINDALDNKEDKFDFVSRWDLVLDNMIGLEF